MLATRMATISSAVARTGRGIAAALRSRTGVAVKVAAAVAALNLVAPVAVLSIARKPADFFTFNPWLRRLPEYLMSSEPLGAKLSFLSHLTIAWVSAEGAEGIDWGFILDVPTLARIAVTSLLFGAYFALWSYQRRIAASAPANAPSRPAGVLGAVTTVFGLTTGPCSLAGCGAPVLPVLGLAFTGVSAGTLAVFAAVSRISIALLLALMGAAVVWFGWRIGGAQPAGCGAEGNAPVSAGSRR
jgi:hypothetical protein